MYKTNILIVEDHPIVLMGIKTLLADLQDAHIFEAQTGTTALDHARCHDIDIAIVDIELADMSGVDLVKTLRTCNPAISVIFYTQHDELWYIAQMEQTSPDAIVLKKDDIQALRTAVELVEKGENYYSKEVSVQRKTTTLSACLSAREQEVVKLIADGLTTQQIAERLFLSANTIEFHRKNVLQKLGAQNSAELIRYAIKYGYLKA